MKISTALKARDTVRGIIQGDSIPDIFIPRLIDLHLQGRFLFDRLITFYPLDEINQACAAAEAGHVLKPVLRLPDPSEQLR